MLAERLLAPVRDAGVDTLVLGCTHYPLLARTIGDVMGRDVVLVSSADETAFEVRSLLEAAGGLRAEPGSPARRDFVTSGDVGYLPCARRPASSGPRSRRWRRWSWS